MTLRADNADQRLTDKGIALGCVGQARAQRHRAKMAALDAAKSLAKSLTITPNEAAKHGLALNRDGHRRSAFELLAYPEIEWNALRGIWPELSAIDPRLPCISRSTPNTTSISSARPPTSTPSGVTRALVLTDIDYSDVPGLSNEARSKLEAARAAHGGAGGPARRFDPGCARHPGGLSAARSAPENLQGDRVRTFHVKRRRQRPCPSLRV